MQQILDVAYIKKGRGRIPARISPQELYVTCISNDGDMDTVLGPQRVSAHVMPFR
jgi:hypothetical protein